MEVYLLYIGKVSCILVIFCLAYQLFLKNETFFKFNRYFLLIGIFCALALPFFSIVNYVAIEPLDYIPINTNGGQANLTTALEDTRIDWISSLFGVYIIGVFILTVKFMVQLVSLYSMTKNNKANLFHGLRYVESSTKIAPFSFFNYLFYNPSLHSERDLSLIIEHEKVHIQQRHTLDVLLTHLIVIATWINPLSWIYQSSVKQNLEFLADEGAIQEVRSTKGYQYALLKVSGNQSFTPIVNTFYNSLIKKRIVMLNKSKSNKRNILKTLSVVPVLAIFLVSFNTKEVYVPIKADSNGIQFIDNLAETIKITIDKNTTDDELKEMRKDLAKKGIDFGYKTVHNAKNEIISIAIDFASKKDNGSKMKSSSSYNNDDGPIDPILIVYDIASNSISIGNAKHMDIHEDDDHNVWVHSDKGDGHKTIEIIEKNGKEVIIVNGKKVSRETYEAMKEKDDVHQKHIKIKKSKHGGDSHVSIWKDSDHDDEDIIEIEDGKGFFFIDTDGDEKTLFLIDGKKSTKEDVKHINPSDIETINVFKGDRARGKYGKKGEDGVIEITTKKKKN